MRPCNAIVAATLMVLSNGANACLGVMNVAATPLGLGTYNPLSASPTTATSQVSVTCNLLFGLGLLPSFTIALSQGIGASYTPRRLANGAHRLSYNLYSDGGYATIWGNGLGGTGLASFNGLLSLGTLNFPVHGRIPAGQDAAPGTYVDTISVLVDF